METKEREKNHTTNFSQMCHCLLKVEKNMQEKQTKRLNEKCATMFAYIPILI